MRVLFIDSNLMLGRNIGLAYVVSAVEAEHQVKVARPFSYQGTNRYGEGVQNLSHDLAETGINGYIMQEIESFSPEVVGFSATSFTFNRSLHIAALLRLTCRKAHFVWGGVHPTLLPEETLRSHLVDAICIGEGEKALPEYIDKLKKGQEPDVDGIWHKDSRGTIIRNRLRAFEDDLNSVPFPDWDWFSADDILKRDLYYMPGSLSILASRGCPYDCSFCSNHAIKDAVPGRYYRIRSPDNIISEIKYHEEKYYAKGFRNIHFADEIFGLDIEWLAEFCSKFKQADLHKRFSWCCATRADTVSKDWARYASEAGCRWVGLGVESGDDYIRQVVYKKGVTRADIINAVENLRNNKINVGFYLMVGCPGESIRSVLSSLGVILKTRPAVFHYMAYMPLPKTDLAGANSIRAWTEGKELRDYWNAPSISTRHSAFNKMNIIIWLMRTTKIFWIFIEGIRAGGIRFVADTFYYFFFGLRDISLSSPYLLSDFEQKTIFRYHYLKKQ